jgi:hypothetical protein
MLPEGLVALSDLGVRDDDLMAIDARSRDDLRIRVPGRRLFQFMRWFDEDPQRETTPWREFSEELITPGILSRDDFPSIYHRHVRRHEQLTKYSPFVKGPELLVADIFELLPTPVQLEALTRTRAENAVDLLWAKAREIERQGVVPARRRGTESRRPACGFCEEPRPGPRRNVKARSTCFTQPVRGLPTQRRPNFLAVAVLGTLRRAHFETSAAQAVPLRSRLCLDGV